MKAPTISGLQGWILPLATAIGVWGGFPKPPEIFIKLARNELFQYLLVFIYIYQSLGSRQDIQTSLIATLIIFLIAKFLDLRKVLDNAFAPAQPTPPIVVIQQQPASDPSVPSVLSVPTEQFCGRRQH